MINTHPLPNHKHALGQLEPGLSSQHWSWLQTWLMMSHHLTTNANVMQLAQSIFFQQALTLQLN